MSQIINYISIPSIFLVLCRLLSRRKHGNGEWVLLRNIRNKKRLSLEAYYCPTNIEPIAVRLMGIYYIKDITEYTIFTSRATTVQKS